MSRSLADIEADLAKARTEYVGRCPLYNVNIDSMVTEFISNDSKSFYAKQSGSADKAMITLDLQRIRDKDASTTTSTGNDTYYRVSIRGTCSCGAIQSGDIIGYDNSSSERYSDSTYTGRTFHSIGKWRSDTPGLISNKWVSSLTNPNISSYTPDNNYYDTTSPNIIPVGNTVTVNIAIFQGSRDNYTNGEKFSNGSSAKYDAKYSNKQVEIRDSIIAKLTHQPGSIDNNKIAQLERELEEAKNMSALRQQFNGDVSNIQNIVDNISNEHYNTGLQHYNDFISIKLLLEQYLYN